MRRLIPALLILCLLAACIPARAAQPFTELSIGSRGDAVKALQQRLIALKLLSGKADGLYGQQTRQAVLSFQQHLLKNGYQVTADGRAGEDTQRLLYDDEAAGELLNLKTGDQGPRVSDLQSVLYDLRLLDDAPDGAYGRKTEQAIRDFQGILMKSGIAGALQTGIADPVTRKYLSGDMKGLNIRVPHNFDDEKPETLTADDLYAKSAILINMNDGTLLLQKEGNARVYPASTTKIMTLLLALESMDPERMVTIPRQARDIPSDSSQVPVFYGEQMPLRDLLYGLMLKSGNDAANAIAVLHSGSIEKFAQRMNEKAGELGMAGSHFVNPHGYHDKEHYTTPADMARLAIAAMKNETFREIISHTEYTMQKTSLRKELPIKVNTELLDPASPFYYREAFGIKSGYTRAAGFCYVGCAQKDGKLLLAIVMNDRTRDQAWTDMGRMFQMGFAK